MTRLKDWKRKHMTQKLVIVNKFAKVLLNNKDFEFFAMFKSKGETHFTGTLGLLKRFKDNQNLIDFQDIMFETRIDSVVREMYLQRDKRVAVDTSPNEASDQMSFCLVWVLQLPKKLICERFYEKNRKPVKSRIEEIETRVKVRVVVREREKHRMYKNTFLNLDIYIVQGCQFFF